MHIETVRFDRVFDVKWGYFSFEANGKPEYGVAFDGEVVPRAGATFAVVLDEPGNWQKVTGWRDLSSATVGLKRSAWDIAFDLVMDMYLFGLLIPFTALLFGGPWAGLLAVVAMVLAAGAIVVGAVLHNRQIERVLHALSTGPAGVVTAPDTQGQPGDPTAPAR